MMRWMKKERKGVKEKKDEKEKEQEHEQEHEQEEITQPSRILGRDARRYDQIQLWKCRQAPSSLVSY